MASEPAALRAVQRWLLAATTHPEGARAGLRAARQLETTDGGAPESDLGPRRGLPLADRLQRYADIHRSQMVGVLARDFPIVERTLGPLAFADLATSYLARNPSQSWRLARLGRLFPDYLAAAEPIAPALRPFLADLGRLERAVDEVFDEVESPSLDAGELERLAQPDWGDARFETISALRLLALEHPAHRYYEAALAGARPPIPQRSPCWLAIWRNGAIVSHAELDRWQQTTLAALASGKPLSTAIEECLALPGATAAALQRELSSWFRTWTERGWFARIGARS